MYGLSTKGTKKNTAIGNISNSIITARSSEESPRSAEINTKSSAYASIIQAMYLKVLSTRNLCGVIGVIRKSVSNETREEHSNNAYA